VKFLTVMILLLGLVSQSLADELVMVRVARPFPETMNSLQNQIRALGYTVSRVQRVDVGLTSSGYKTAEYRLVFFGKEQELRKISARHPDLIPYYPLTIVVIAEEDETLLLATNPLKLMEFFNKPGLDAQFSQWERDIRSIMGSLLKPE